MRLALAGALLAVAADAAAGQLPGILKAGSYWQDVYYPKVFYTARDGLTGGAYLAFVAPMSYSDYDLPPPYRAAITLDGQISTSGSRQVSLDARAPFAADGWRFALTLAAQRRARESYYGLGNASIYDPANQTDAQPDFYRSRNVRLYARGEVQRRIIGNLRLLAGLHAERWRIEPIAGASQLANDLAAGADPTIGRPVGDVAARVGLVFDSRDNEVAPDRGVLLEAIHGVADSGVAGALSYTRTTVSARGYVPLAGRWVVAGRVVGQGMTGAPRIGSSYLVEASDRPYEALGGPGSHRGLLDYRLIGPDKLFGNLDVRYTLYEIPTLLRVSVIGFLDAGRVFDTGQFEVTTRDLAVGAGGGLFLKMFRAGVLGMTVGGGPDGVAWNAHTGWTF